MSFNTVPRGKDISIDLEEATVVGQQMPVFPGLDIILPLGRFVEKSDCDQRNE